MAKKLPARDPSTGRFIAGSNPRRGGGGGGGGGKALLRLGRVNVVLMPFLAGMFIAVLVGIIGRFASGTGMLSNLVRQAPEAVAMLILGWFLRDSGLFSYAAGRLAGILFSAGTGILGGGSAAPETGGASQALSLI